MVKMMKHPFCIPFVATKFQMKQYNRLQTSCILEWQQKVVALQKDFWRITLW